MNNFKNDEDLFILFAHASYQLDDGFKAHNLNYKSKQVYNYEDLKKYISETDILCVSGIWDNNLIDLAENLKYIQLTGVGYDAFDLDKLKSKGIKLCNAVGLNTIVVAEHTMSLILSFSRYLHIARDNQNKKYWAPFISDPNERQAEINGKTVVIFGLGAIGNTIAKFCKSFDMNVNDRLFWAIDTLSMHGATISESGEISWSSTNFIDNIEYQILLSDSINTDIMKGTVYVNSVPKIISSPPEYIQLGDTLVYHIVAVDKNKAAPFQNQKSNILYYNILTYHYMP